MPVTLLNVYLVPYKTIKPQHIVMWAGGREGSLFAVFLPGDNHDPHSKAMVP